MVGTLLLLAAQATLVASAPVDPVPVKAIAPAEPSAPFNPSANALFERDPAIKGWAVRIHDRNHDGWLTTYEAQAALAAFKTLADGDRDGRITTYEYDRAKEFIAAR